MRLLAHLTLLGGLMTTACDKPPIIWDDPVAIAQSPGATTLMVDSAGKSRFVEPAAKPASTPSMPGLCSATLVTAVGLHRVFAGWWAVRRDSSAILQVAWSPDSGRTWGKPLAVDTTDVSSVGCTRPPPAITAVGDDVYVAYSMIAPEGKGVFFAHTMGSMLHSPVPVIYGERLVATAIAAEDPRVLVAYEEPNGHRARIDFAISATQGHTFDLHAVASRDVDDAMSPAVAFNGRAIAVSWIARSPAGAALSRVVRIGRMQ
jgi:hypothetical protein